MGSPAVSRFLYTANIANKIRKSSESLAKRIRQRAHPLWFFESAQVAEGRRGCKAPENGGYASCLSSDGYELQMLRHVRDARSICRSASTTHVDHGDGFEHTDPAALALVARDYEAERALVGAEGLAIDGVDDENGLSGEILVEFGEREGGAIAVGAFGDDHQRHALASQGRALRHSGFGEQGADRNAVVLMHLIVMTLGADGFAGKFLQAFEA